MERLKQRIRKKPMQRELIMHIGVKERSVNRMAERVVTQNVHTSPNLYSYYLKSMLYKILIYVGRVHLVEQDARLHLMGK
ncbi:hypothetical protein AHAS_Ahas17G0251600 [Arachis hypogaea]